MNDHLLRLNLTIVGFSISTPPIAKIMCQKCEGKTVLWDILFRLKKYYAENMKKIVGAVWELPAK